LTENGHAAPTPCGSNDRLERMAVGQIATALRIERLDGKLGLPLSLELSLKGCLGLRLLLFLRAIIRFLWLNHNELLLSYEHRRHFEIADLLRRRSPRATMRLPLWSSQMIEGTASVGSLIE
jgi:hypothetical protein